METLFIINDLFKNKTGANFSMQILHTFIIKNSIFAVGRIFAPLLDNGVIGGEGGGGRGSRVVVSIRIGAATRCTASQRINKLLDVLPSDDPAFIVTTLSLALLQDMAMAGDAPWL
ncbi:hypothetical protein BpHYR1_044104 [Brachionus plicatilis]|uniref:Uncharacterized protein n=1 Tax=Brachionus plicatilis TaxID=10195 RepID=A0A3M7Q9C7_BRAPC|nr:hypothetical protein BpHYR1_044104 [Brachionus plicatilis]